MKILKSTFILSIAIIFIFSFKITAQTSPSPTNSDIEIHETKDNMVISTGHYNAKNKKTVKVIKAQFTHHWLLENGKVTKYQQYADTYQVVDAMK